MQRVVVMALLVGAGFMACIPDPPADLNSPDAGRPGYDGGGSVAAEGGLLGVSATPPNLDFGGGDCGGAAPSSKRVTLKNAGKESVEYKASLVGKGFAVAGLARGVVAPGADVLFDVKPDPMPQTARAGDLRQAVLKIETNDVTAGTLVVPLKVRATGGELELTPEPLDFGSFPEKSTVPLSLSFRNKGNAALRIKPDVTPSEFSISGETFEVAANSVVPKTVSFRPSLVQSFEGSLSLHVEGAVCGSVPTSVSLKGKGVVAGQPYVTPGTLDFGTTSCGDAAPAAQSVTLMNATGTPSIDAAHAAYYDVSEAGGVFTVTPKKLPLPISLTAGAYDATLTLAGSGVAPITISQSVQGAVLKLDTTDVDFGGVPLGEIKDLPFVVRNEGNMAAQVSLSLVDPSAFYLALPSASVASPSFPFTVSYRGIPAQSRETMTMTATGSFCTDPPVGLITLRGEGVFEADAAAADRGIDGGVDFDSSDLP